jgi:hypothetical protein
MNRVKPTCVTCDSDAINCDASAEWDCRKQEWVMTIDSDDYYCCECGGETSIKWVEAP